MFLVANLQVLHKSRFFQNHTPATFLNTSPHEVLLGALSGRWTGETVPPLRVSISPPCSLLPPYCRQSSSSRHTIHPSSSLNPPFYVPQLSPLLPPSLHPSIPNPSSGSPTHPSTYQLSFIISIKLLKSNVLGVVSVSEMINGVCVIWLTNPPSLSPQYLVNQQPVYNVPRIAASTLPAAPPQMVRP